MLRRNIQLLLYITTCLALFGCGYHHPLADKDEYKGAPTTVYIDIWPNRTNEVGLETTIFKSLSSWFRKTPHIKHTQDKEKADYTLQGEIVSINVPGLSFGQFETEQEENAVLTIQYSLMKTEDNKIVWDTTKRVFEEEYVIEDDAPRTRNNRTEALAVIADDLSELIYFRMIRTLSTGQVNP